jgi:DNA invertase Pin-like site-specific DNA recombinase
MLTGYARVSGIMENIQIQIQKLEAAGCQNVIKEKISTAKSRNSFQLILEKLSPGDIIIATSIDRITDSLQELTHLLNRINQAEAHICFLDQDIDTSKVPVLFDITRHFAEFDTTRKAGNHRTGPKRKFNDESIREMLRMYDNRTKISKICARFSVSEPSFWRFLKNRGKYRQSVPRSVQ